MGLSSAQCELSVVLEWMPGEEEERALRVQMNLSVYSVSPTLACGGWACPSVTFFFSPWVCFCIPCIHQTGMLDRPSSAHRGVEGSHLFCTFSIESDRLAYARLAYMDCECLWMPNIFESCVLASSGCGRWAILSGLSGFSSPPPPPPRLFFVAGGWLTWLYRTVRTVWERRAVGHWRLCAGHALMLPWKQCGLWLWVI